MGAGIAQVAAAAGCDVILLDTVPQAAQRALEEISRRLASLEQKGKAASTFIYPGYNHDHRLRTTPMHQLMACAGMVGRKTGRGFHDYGDATMPDQPAPSSEAPFALTARSVEPDARWQAVATRVELIDVFKFDQAPWRLLLG